MPGYTCVSFLSDYGQSDGFVAACHGVLIRAVPSLRIIDITHQIPPQRIRRGAAVLAQTVPWLPPAVHLAVVDPGVGTTRRAVAVLAGDETQQSILVGPDNGLLSWTWARLGGARSAVALENPAYQASTVSATFHGRDIFAPAAAHLAFGVALAELGPAVDPSSLVRLPKPTSTVRDGTVEAEVVSVDGFGNIQLAATPMDLDTAGLRLGDDVLLQATGAAFPARFGRTFGDVPPGALVVLVDSAGYTAIAANGGSAAAVLSVGDTGTIVLCVRR